MGYSCLFAGGLFQLMFEFRVIGTGINDGLYKLECISFQAKSDGSTVMSFYVL